MSDRATDLMAPDDSEIRMDLLAEPSSVVLARELVRYALTNWGFSRTTIDDSKVVISELVTNAIAAAPGHQIRIRAAIHEGAPLLECWDPSPEMPSPRHASEYAESGRGLTIIAAYAKDTGTRPAATNQGKVIWALMPT